MAKQEQPTPQQAPAAWAKSYMRPTLNGTGFMFENRDAYADEFIEYAGQIDDRVLDIGCAFGVATIPALERGARVVACDMEPRHLEGLREATPEECLPRLECVVGQLPTADLPDAGFGAILCSRVLHFLDGAAVDASVRAMYRWLKPGGRLYLIADTPYGIWRRYIPVFEAKRDRGDRWPGLMVGLENYLPYPPKGRGPDGPPFMNLLDPDLLSRVCIEAGFDVERATYIDRSDFDGLGRMDGRENAGILAVKPA